MSERKVFILMWIVIILIEVIAAIWLLLIKNPVSGFVFGFGIIPSVIFLLLGILTKEENF